MRFFIAFVGLEGSPVNYFVPIVGRSAELARTPDQFNTLNDFTMIYFYTGEVDTEIDAVRIGSAVA